MGFLDNAWPKAFQFGSSAAQAVPEPVARAASRVAGVGFSQAMLSSRRMVERHMRRAYGPTVDQVTLQRAVQSVFDSYARYWVESFRLPKVTAAELDAGFSYEGFGHILEGLEAGHGVILGLPHLGGWEWGGFWLSAVQRLPITVVVERLEPPELFESFKELREGFGMNVIGLGPDVGKHIVSALNNNHVVALLCDRDLTRSGIEVDFFGERTTLPAGPATLALRTGATLVPTAIYFEGRTGHRGVVLPPLDISRHGKFREDVTRVTQDLALNLERLIRADPTQWHLLQPNWPSDPGYHQ